MSGRHPLPPSLPNLRDRLVYHERLAAHTLQRAVDGSDPNSSDDDEVEFEADSMGDRVGFKELTLDILKVRLSIHSL